MARILLSAYACEPGRGSEPAVGWNWAAELVRLGHAVTVITRAANRPAIEANKQQPPSLNFIYYDLPRWAQRMRRFPAGKHLYYLLWQCLASRMLRRRSLTAHFDLVQHVTYVSVRLPSFMGSLGLPFYFGPVSGGEAVPPALRPGCSAGERLRERLRDISNRLVACDPWLRRSFRQASRILVTPDTMPLLPRSARHKATETLAIGLPAHDSRGHRESRSSRSGLRLLYVGRLLEWKGVDICLRAFQQVRRLLPETSLAIVGDGPAKSRLLKLCRQLQLEEAVTWCGWLPPEKVVQHYQSSALLIFPSLRDSGGMVVLEALARELPVVCTDLGGPGLIVNRSCGRAVPTSGYTREELAHEIARVVQEILSTPGRLELLRRGAKIRARDFSFEALVRSIHPPAQARVRQA